MDKIIKKISKYSSVDLEKYLNGEKLDTLHSLKLYLDDIYYNTGENSLFSDAQYDLLKEIIQKKQPEYIPPIGAKIRKDDNKVLLKYWMGSMDKIKPENKTELNRWLKKNKAPNYIVENKLDGVSCLLEIQNGIVNLYTRGDGKIGSDISHLSPFLSTIPSKIKTNINIRGELIINKDIFYKNYSSKFANPRNMVSGIINSKSAKPELKDIDFVAYEIIDEKNENLSPEEQLIYLKKLGFKTVKYSIIEDVNVENLISVFLKSKESCDYEIDGIIVQSNIKYKRNISGNPDYAFAFKVRMDTNLINAEVEEVEWNISKWGVLKPRIRIKPVILNGVNIQYTSGFNARYIMDNKVGKGTIIELTRSGDVIPYIVKIVKNTKAEMPTIPYKWNKTNVDIYTEENSNIVCIKLLTFFFSKLKIKYVSDATVEKLYNYGLDNVIKIISATKEDFMKVGFGDKVAERAYDNIHKSLSNISIPLLLGSSGIFGFNIGERKLELLFNEYPDILTFYSKKPKKELFDMVNSIKGFSNITTEKIVENLKWADKFIKLLKKYITFKTENKTSDNLMGMTIVFSGFRDLDMESDIKKRGGKVTTSVSKNTTILVVNKKDNTNSKYIKALELKIPVFTKEEFIELCNLSNKVIIEKLKIK